jgi:SAM-dependent methyltransferase
MDFARISAMAGGHAEARATQVALKLGMFEALKDVQRDATGLAAIMGTEPRATMLLANALVALGLLKKSDQRFGLVDASRRYLVQTSPEYLGGMILFDAQLWDAWGRLEDSIRTGKPARLPDMFQTRSEDTSQFIAAMDSLVRARGDAQWTAAHLDLGFARTIVDLGGGPGTYLIEFLRRWPEARGAIWDLKATLEVARSILSKRESWALGRIDLREVDYNYNAGELPGPVDVIFLSNIVHGEDEPTNARLMTRCFRALNPGGLIILKDHIMNDELTEPAAGAVFALFMLLTTYGRDYSFNEVREWLKTAGFGEIQKEDLPSPPFTSSIVVARKRKT